MATVKNIGCKEILVRTAECHVHGMVPTVMRELLMLDCRMLAVSSYWPDDLSLKIYILSFLSLQNLSIFFLETHVKVYYTAT
jgi:hypothetical protein